MLCVNCGSAQTAYHGGWWNTYCLHPGPHKGRSLCATKKKDDREKLRLIETPPWCPLNSNQEGGTV